MRRIQSLLLIPLAAACALASMSTRASGQIPYYVFNDSTQVASIDFRFVDGRTFGVSTLREQIALTEKGGWVGVRRVLSFLPLISPVGDHPFDLLELQRDVARLRAFYGGFVGTDISYEVTFDEDENQVDVVFVVDEGRPVTIRSIRVVTPSNVEPPSELPEALAEGWMGFLRQRGDRLIGQRYTDEARTGLATDVLDWWAERGWAFVSSTVDAPIDSAEVAADLTIHLDPGPRADIESIEVEGNEAVSDEVILGMLPFEVGDLYSEAEITAGQRRLFGLDLFRLVLVDAPLDQPRDSSVRIRVRVQEGEPRLFVGELGYMSAGSGITGRAEITHRNFLGGARALQVAGTFRTGVLALGSLAEREYGLTVTYRRPFLFEPRLSLSIAPYGRYRDNFIDRSWEGGIESTLIYELGARRYLTLQHRLSTRHVLDFRPGSRTSMDLATVLALATDGTFDSLERRADRSVLGLSVAVGRFDPTTRAPALQIQPVVEVTAPPVLNTVEFALVDLPISGFLPLGEHVALAASGRIGRVFPFGKSITGDSIVGLQEALQLNDVLLRAGGTGSVRGWGNGLLGPKSMDLLFSAPEGGDTVAISSNGYLPAGGLARANGSLELRLPFPGLSERWGTHLFFDAGRVWSPDDRFHTVGLSGDDDWFFGTGAGFDVATVAGPIRFSVGYKLNPSPLDVRDPGEVLQAILEGRPLTTVDVQRIRRFHFHVALGLPS